MVHVAASVDMAELPVQLSTVFTKGAATVALEMVNVVNPLVLVSVKTCVELLPIVTLP